MIQSIVTFYLTGALVIGALVGCMESVTAKYKDKPLPFGRIITATVAGVVWPYTAYQLVASFRR